MTQTRYAKKKRPRPPMSPVMRAHADAAEQPPWRPSRPDAEAAVNTSPSAVGPFGSRLFGGTPGLAPSDRRLIRELITTLQTNIAVMRGEDPDAFVPPPATAEEDAEAGTPEDEAPQLA